MILVMVGIFLVGMGVGLSIRWWRNRDPLRGMPAEPPVIVRRRTHRNVMIGHRAHAADLFHCRPEECTDAMVAAAKRDLYGQAMGAGRSVRQRWLDNNFEIPHASLPIPRKRDESQDRSA